MQFVLRTARHTWRWGWRLSAAGVVLLALSLVLARLLLPLLGDYRTQLQQALSDYLVRPVQVERLQLTWWGWGPALRVHGFNILDHRGRTVTFGFDQALVQVDFSRSLWRGRLVFATLQLRGGELTISQPRNHVGSLQIQQQTMPPIALDRLLAQLYSVETLDLEFSRVRWQYLDQNYDLGQGLRVRLSPVTGHKRHLNMEMQLESRWGKRLQMMAELSGDPAQPDSWQTRFYLHGSSLTPATWPALSLADKGYVELELWGDWTLSGFGKLLAQARSQRPRFTRLGSTAQTDWRLDAQGERRGESWQWRTQMTSHGRDGEMAAAADLVLERADTGTWIGRIDRLDIAELSQIALPWLPPKPRIWLRRLKPKGLLSKVVFQLNPEQRQLSLNAELNTVGTSAWRRIPGFDGLQGRLSLSGDRGRLDKGHLELDSGTVQFDWSAQRTPMPLIAVRGPIRWREVVSGWRVDAQNLVVENADLRVRVNGGATLLPSDSPLFDLRLDYEHIDVARIPAYIPAQIMDPSVVTWMDHALVSGRVAEGDLHLRGRLNDFPFDHGRGRFDARFRVIDTRLDYQPNWPGIENLQGECQFHNRTFTAKLDSGRILDATLRQASLKIENLAQAELLANATLTSPSAGMLRFLRQGPLARKVGIHLPEMEVSGDNDLDLRLRVPLKHRKTQSPEVEGEAHFSGNQLVLPEHAVTLEQVNGALHFTQDSLTADALDLRFRGSPAKLQVATDQGTKPVLRFNLRGIYAVDALAGPDGALFEPYLDGRSVWNIELKVPKGESEQGYRLELRSNLRGIQVNLPEPLAKPASEKRAFRAVTTVKNERSVIQLDYEPATSAALMLEGETGARRIPRGEVRIDRGQAKLPENPGVALIAAVADYELSAAGDDDSLIGFDRMQVDIGTVRLSEWSLPGVEVKGQRSSDGLHLLVSGNAASGEVFVPLQPSDAEPIHVALQRAFLRKDDSAKEDLLAVKVIPPPLTVSVDQLKLDDQVLGRLVLVAVPTANGYRLNRLELSADEHQLSGEGEWRRNGQQGDVTEVQAKFYSRALGDSLALFGQEFQIEQAETAVQMDLSWPGDFAEFSLADLTGEIDLHIGPGNLVDIDPGVGRLFGLLNMASAGRRFQLDFSDFVNEGLAFDQVDSQLRFADGQITTEDLLLQGPSVQITSSGTIDLLARTINHKITVSPQIGTSLAIAGTLAGGPAVGAIVLVAGQVLKPGIDKAIGYQYSISGDWDDPVVEQIAIPADTPSIGSNRK